MGGWDKNASDVPRETLIKIIIDISIDKSNIYIYQELTWWSKNIMNFKYKIKNFFTFGLMKRLDEAECKIINLRESVSGIDVDSQVEDEINRRNILTEDNFSPSDYDLVSSDDYDFDSFVDTDVEDTIRDYLADYHDAASMDTAIKEGIEEHQGELVKSMVKKVCTEMLVDWCERTAKAANKQEETDSSSDNS